MKYLCVSVTFLTHAFHGVRDRGEPEWPPSPMRLYQALVAGAHAGARARTWSDATAEAFRWLERLGPPVIVAPHARVSPVATVMHVPNNESDAIMRREGRLTEKRARPHVLGDDRTVHYLWPLPDAGAGAREERDTDPGSHERHAAVICREARHLTALGWGIDLVVGDGRLLSETEAAALDGVQWIPRMGTRAADNRVIVVRGPHVNLRTPRDGSLDDIKAVHDSFCRKLEGGVRGWQRPLTVFNNTPYTVDDSLPARPCAVFSLPDGMALSPVNAVAAAAMLRSLACRPENRDDFASEFGDDPGVYVAGHVGKLRGYTPPRFSYLPLPTIGHERADGRIRRLMIAEPRGGSGERAGWAAQRLLGQPLRDRSGTEVGILCPPRKDPRYDYVVQLYTKPHLAWASVTPVILPGYDEGCHLKAERLFIKAVEHEGIPLSDVSDVTLRKAPFWPGAEHPRAYLRPKYLLRYSAWHAHIVFRRPVSGPVSIGSGRHCGLGVFAATDG